MPYITGSRLKAERARVHLEELEREIEAFFNAHPYQFFRRPNPENVANILYEFPPQPVPPETLGPILSDIVHNLRSALDHIAWQLALLTKPTPYPKTAFPIFIDSGRESIKDFNRLTQDVLPAAIPIIEALQPYHHSQEQREFHLLWVLHCLWNADKHRLLTTIPHRISAPVFSGPGGSNRTLEDGTVVVEVPATAEPDKNLEPYIKRQVLFEIPGSGYRAEIERIRLMYSCVANEIVPFFSRYLPESTGLVERQFGTRQRYI